MIQRTLTLLTSLIFIFSCSTKKDLVIIPANSTYEIQNPPNNNYHAVLDLKNFAAIDVKVVSRENGVQKRGFGLGWVGDATVLVEKENKLVLENTSSKKARIRTQFKEKNQISTTKTPKTPAKPEIVYKKFTLLNTSNVSLPLYIPSVMNPNLSPNSSSGVSLKIGQEILFRYKGKKHVLLTVTDEINNGDKIDAAVLLQKRKDEIDNSK